MKKLIAFCLTVILCCSLFACSFNSKQVEMEERGYDTETKVGFVFVGDKNQAYTNAYYEAAMAMMEKLGLDESRLVFKWNVAENEEAYDAAVDLADKSCDIIFSNSYGHEEYFFQAAIEYPDVQFCHFSGNRAKNSELKNVHNFFQKVHESRYVSGIVAGMKLNEMIEKKQIKPEEAKIGYVAAFSYPEIVSGYTAFYLGARSVCESATMDVKYIGTWSDEELEQGTTLELIENDCVLIGHHSNTNTVALVCEEEGVPVVGYHASVIDVAPTQALTSAKINWEPYLTFAVKSVMDGETLPVEWSKGYENGSVMITELNLTSVAKGTKDAVEKAVQALKDGDLQVFDITTWKVNDEMISTTAVKSLEASYHGEEYIKNGAFMESELNSSPAFSFRIDGITELNQGY